MQHFPDGPDAQHVALVLSLPLIVPQFCFALLNKQSNCSSLCFVFSNCVKVLASLKAEVSYVCHRNDVDRLQMITVDIKRIHSVDIHSIEIEIYIIHF